MADGQAPGWNDERVDLLKRLWADGLSCGAMAREIGGVTRNAVIGKVTRLGLNRGDGSRQKVRTRPLDAPPRRNGATHRRSARSIAIAETVTRVTNHGNRFDVVEARVAPSLPEVPEELTPEAIARRVPFVGLRAHMCRFPVTGLHAPEFMFCGGPPVEPLPYCAYHCRIAYMRPGAAPREAAFHCF